MDVGVFAGGLRRRTDIKLYSCKLSVILSIWWWGLPGEAVKSQTGKRL